MPESDPLEIKAYQVRQKLGIDHSGPGGLFKKAVLRVHSYRPAQVFNYASQKPVWVWKRHQELSQHSDPMEMQEQHGPLPVSADTEGRPLDDTELWLHTNGAEGQRPQQLEQDWRPEEAVPEDFYSFGRDGEVVRYAFSQGGDPLKVGSNGVSHEFLHNWLGKKSSRRLGSNKVIYRDGDDIHVKLHNTNVVTVHKDGTYTVRTGGWNTPTTRNTISYFTGLPTYSHKFVAHIQGLPLEEGMKVPVLPEAPEVDWRPSETIPEDHYSFRREGEKAAHSLIAGHRIEHVLRHLTTDPRASKDTQQLAARVLYHGDTDALYPLNDSLQEDGHPLHSQYNWFSAASKLHTDAAVGHAIHSVAATLEDSPFPVADAHTALSDHLHSRPAEIPYSAVEAVDALKEGGLGHDEIAESLDRHHRRLVDADSNRFGLTDNIKKQALDPVGLSQSLPKGTLRKQIESTRYGKSRVRRPIHPLLRGTRLAIVLKQLAGDRDDVVRATARTALREGDLTSLGVLHDRLDEIDHPINQLGYDFRGAMRKLKIDEVVHSAIDRAGTRIDPDADPRTLSSYAALNANMEAGVRQKHPELFDEKHDDLLKELRISVPDATPNELRGSLLRRALKHGDSAVTTTEYDSVNKQNQRGKVAAALSPELTRATNWLSTEHHETPDHLAAARFRFRRGDPALATAFNAEFNKVADRLHEKHGVADLDQFKQQDHYGKILSAVNGNEQLAADTATGLLYDGQLERRHQPGQPLKPLLTIAGKYATRKDEENKHRQLGGDVISDVRGSDGERPNLDTSEEASAFRTNIKPGASLTAKLKAAWRTKMRTAPDDLHQKRLLERLAKKPEGYTLSELSNLHSLPVDKIRELAEKAGAVLATRPTRTYTSTIVLPPGTRPPENPREKRNQSILTAADEGKGYDEIAAAHGLNRNQINGILQRLRGLRKNLKQTKPRREMATQFARSDATSDFVAALRRVRSRQQEVLRKVAGEIRERLKLEPSVTRDAIYDHPTAALANLAQQFQHNDKEKARVASAWFLLQSQTPSGLLFHVGEGEDFVHRVSVPGSGERIRANLDRAGIRQRVLLPTKTGYDILIFDKGGQKAAAVQDFANRSGGQLKSAKGEGELLGGSDEVTADSGSRRSYRSIIRAWEQKQQEKQSGQPAVRSGLQQGSPLQPAGIADPRGSGVDYPGQVSPPFVR